ncbi:MAG: putative transport protein [Bacteroidia bacterium]|jgi:predicted transport protein
MRDVSTTGHWGNGDFEIQVKDDDNLEYILSLVKQSIRKNKK